MCVSGREERARRVRAGEAAACWRGWRGCGLLRSGGAGDADDDVVVVVVVVVGGCSNLPFPVKAETLVAHVNDVISILGFRRDSFPV